MPRDARLPSVKVLVACHKPTPMRQTEVFVPIHVGRAISSPTVRSNMSHVQGDDQGDNISAKNPWFAELTAIYWAWKNLGRLENPDYIGLFHYRRFLNFGTPLAGKLQFDRIYRDYSEATCLRHGWEDETVRQLCASSDIIMPEIEGILSPRDWSSPSTLADHYRLQHPEEMLERTRETISRRNAAYLPAYDAALASKLGYFCNMFIMRQEIFVHYAEWLFDLLSDLESRTNLNQPLFQPPSPQTRVFGFLGERLLNVYLTHRKSRHRDRIGEYQFITADFSNIVPHEASSDPKVTIVVPVYNVAPFLRECLDSLVRQTLKDIEIIAVNDGSTDASPSILEEYSALDKRVVVVNQPNSGLAASRNRGLELARGKYVAFVDSDDYCDTTMFEKLYNKAEQVRADVVTCSVYRFLDGQVDQKWLHRDLTWFHTADAALPITYRPEQFLEPAGWCKLFRREYVQQIGFQYTHGSVCCEDVPCTTLAFLNTERIGVVPEALYYYRQRPGSITDRMSTRYIQDFVHAMKEQKRIMDAHPDRLNDRTRQCIAEFKAIMANFVCSRLSRRERGRFYKLIGDGFFGDDIESIRNAYRGQKHRFVMRVQLKAIQKRSHLHYIVNASAGGKLARKIVDKIKKTCRRTWPGERRAA